MKKILLFLSLISFSSLFAMKLPKAVLEPYGGTILFGDYQLLDSQSSNQFGDLDGFVYGARLGAEYFGVGLGAYVEGGRYTVDGGTAYQETAIDTKHMGLYLSYTHLDKVRALFGYSLDSNVYLENDRFFDGGNSYLISLGYKFSNKVFINLEWRDTQEHEVGGSSRVDLYDSYGLSISVPFELKL